MANKKGKNKGYSYKYNKSGTVTCRKYFTMPDENRKQLSATGKSEAEARNELDEKYAMICRRGKEIKSKGYTVKSWCQYWLKNVKTNLKGNTKDSYYDSFTNHIIPLLGRIKLKDLQLSQIQEAVNKVKETEVIRNGIKTKVTGKTVKEIFAPFKQALQYAMDENLMPYINLKRLDMPQVRKGTRAIRNKREQQIVTDYFANRLPDKPFDLYYAPIAVMDARGIRPEECAGLRWEDINYEEDTFWVGRHTVVKNATYNEDNEKIGNQIVVEASAKTLQGERELALGKYLSSIFKAKYEEYIRKGITPKATDFIFINKVGNLFYEQSLRKMYKSLAKKLEISELGCYSLRHEFATYLVQVEKADTETCKQTMGWKNFMETYIHTDMEQKRKAVVGIDKQFEKEKIVDEIEEGNNIQNKILFFPIKKAII